MDLCCEQEPWRRSRLSLEVGRHVERDVLLVEVLELGLLVVTGLCVLGLWLGAGGPFGTALQATVLALFGPVGYALPVLDPPVGKSIRFAEAPARGRSILRHAPSSPGAEAYRALAKTLHADVEGQNGREPVKS